MVRRMALRCILQAWSLDGRQPSMFIGQVLTGWVWQSRTLKFQLRAGSGLQQLSCHSAS